MIDGRLIEVTAIGELSLGWTKDGRRVTYNFGTSDYLINGGRLIGRRLMEVQLSMVRKTPIESSFCEMVCGSNLVPRSHSVFIGRGRSGYEISVGPDCAQ